MQYIRVEWNHDLRDEPVLLYSELDGDRREVRKVEVFRDGSLGYAGQSSSSESTWLGELPVPPLDEIAKNSEFKPAEIGKDEFEGLWARATKG